MLQWPIRKTQLYFGLASLTGNMKEEHLPMILKRSISSAFSWSERAPVQAPLGLQLVQPAQKCRQGSTGLCSLQWPGSGTRARRVQPCKADPGGEGAHGSLSRRLQLLLQPKGQPRLAVELLGSSSLFFGKLLWTVLSRIWLPIKFRITICQSGN